jgi:hypothetical protein
VHATGVGSFERVRTYAGVVTRQPADDRPAAIDIAREEVLRRGRPLPPLEESAIEDLTDAEWQAFWDAINNL